MAKKNKKISLTQKSKGREIFGIIILLLSIILSIALVSYKPGDWPGPSGEVDEQLSKDFLLLYKNKISLIGAYISFKIFEGVGFTSYALAVLMIIIGVTIFLHKRLIILLKPAIFLCVWGVFLPIIVALIVDYGADNTRVDPSFEYGGILGGFLGFYMATYLGKISAFLISIAAILVSVVIATSLKPSTMVEYVVKAAGFIISSTARKIHKPYGRKKKHEKAYKSATKIGDIEGPPDDYKEETPFLTPVEEEPSVEPALSNIAPPIQFPERPDFITSEEESLIKDDFEQAADLVDEELFGEEREISPKEYVLPTIDLLDKPERDQLPESREEMIEKANDIVKNLSHFNIESEVLQITPGPIVTRYELTLAPGVKVGRVVSLSDDLALALKAKGGIRILAPIPGKAAIGIEVPNKKRSTVYFREVVESEAFLSTDEPLVLALGKNTAGEPVIADLAKMPHLLIAGATGSGKSVCINTIIASILLKAPPDKVRILLVDPKVVELTLYNYIPHLLTPVVTNSNRVSEALKWTVREMESRYRQLASIGVRNITQYNIKIAEMTEKADQEELKEIPPPLPFIVVIIDEFADLMFLSSTEIEESIARLAQMARAVGIHLVLATQRPSADVITGLIKANFPSRIAFKVMQASNSRIILDQNGADKLLGLGDMLFLQVGKPEPIRLHGAFISNDECIRIVEFISSQHTKGLEVITDEMFKEEPDEDNNALGLRDPNARDVLFFKAARLVTRTNQGSVSLLQRRLKIGYARAARLIDQLELAGIVSPYDGSKAREVLVNDQYIDELEAGDL